MGEDKQSEMQHQTSTIHIHHILNVTRKQETKTKNNSPIPTLQVMSDLSLGQLSSINKSEGWLLA